MGKVIILAGAPDPASLEWSAIIDDCEGRAAAHGTTQDAEAPWQHGNDSTHDVLSGNPQWRSVLLEGGPELQTESSQGSACPGGDIEHDASPEGDSVQAQMQREWEARRSNVQAEFATFTESESQSQSRRPDWSVSSADMASLSVRLPGVLPLPHPGLDYLTSTPSFFLSGETTASQELIEHSLAIHNALPSSLPDPSDFSRGAGDVQSNRGRAEDEQVANNVDKKRPQAHAPRYIPTSFNTSLATSFDETAASVATAASFTASIVTNPPPLPSALPRWQPLTHLVDIPDASVLGSLIGRTVTVNLAVAVVAVSAPRAVAVRQSADLPNARPASSLVELVVGDDTRSGFGITVWLDAPSLRGPSGQPSSLASLLPTLHPQDIVLVRNLALNAFGGKVYGSTLRRNQTHVHVLYRQGRSRDEQLARNGDDSLFSAAHLAAANAVLLAASAVQANGPQPEDSHPQQSVPPGWKLAAKVSRVRDWALQYVVAGNEGRDLEGRTAAGNVWMQPPADTQ